MAPNDTPLTIDPDVLLRKAHAIGTYYGFRYVPDYLQEKQTQKEQRPLPNSVQKKTLDTLTSSFVQFLHKIDQHRTVEHETPLFLWSSNATPGRKTPKHVTVSFHILGVEQALADALMIRTVQALVHELTREPVSLRVNSLGDQDTAVRYARELTNYFKKYYADLSPQTQQLLKQDVIDALDHLLRYDDALGTNAPSPMDYLSESSRLQLEDLLEYLEATGTQYELAPHAFERKSPLHEVCFEFRTPNGPLAVGGRYTNLAKQFFPKKRGHAVVGMVRAQAKESRACKPLPKKRTQPSIVFVQVGPEAKRLSLSLIEDLRREHIKIVQTIGYESLMDQMAVADSLDAPFIMIMGQKEALEQSVIIRDRRTNSQQVVPLDNLIEYLQNILK